MSLVSIDPPVRNVRVDVDSASEWSGTHHRWFIDHIVDLAQQTVEGYIAWHTENNDAYLILTFESLLTSTVSDRALTGHILHIVQHSTIATRGDVRRSNQTGAPA